MEIWRYVWRENYAQTIVQFADNEVTSTILCNAIQSKPYSFENLHDHFEESLKNSLHSNHLSSSNSVSSSVNNQRCRIL
jgi:hypothetical protein